MLMWLGDVLGFLKQPVTFLVCNGKKIGRDKGPFRKANLDKIEGLLLFLSSDCEMFFFFLH